MIDGTVAVIRGIVAVVALCVRGAATVRCMVRHVRRCHRWIDDPPGERTSWIWIAAVVFASTWTGFFSVLASLSAIGWLRNPGSVAVSDVVVGPAVFGLLGAVVCTAGTLWSVLFYRNVATRTRRWIDADDFHRRIAATFPGRLNRSGRERDSGPGQT